MGRDEELGALCRACGMCCDGTLFGRVGLQQGEAPEARRRGLHVVERGTAFEQPCPAFDGSGCSIYDARPHACRVFRCRLFERHRVEGGPILDRLAAVARVRELIASADRGELTPEECDELEERVARDFGRA